MKTFSTLTALALLIAFGGAYKLMLMRVRFSIQIIDQCIEDHPLETDEADSLIRGNLTIDSDTAKCFIKCFWYKTGFINEDDEPQYEFIADSLLDTVVLKRPTLLKIAEKCFRFRGEYTCETAFKIFKCLYKRTNIPDEIPKTGGSDDDPHPEDPKAEVKSETENATDDDDASKVEL